MTAVKPQHERSAEDDPAQSGARRIVHIDAGDAPLPPPPNVLVNRPRIVTGRYTVVRPQPSDRKED